VILRRVHSGALGVAAVLAFATEVGYLWIILRQQDAVEPGVSGRVLVVAATMAVAGAVGVVGAVTSSPTIRAKLAAIATGGLVPLGVLAAFSIGLPLLVARLLALGACIGALRHDASTRTLIWAVVAALVAAGVLAVGLLLT